MTTRVEFPGLDTPGLEDVLASTGDGATVIGGDGRIRFWNAAAEQILGRTSRDVLGRPCCEVFAGLDDKLQALCSSTCQIMSLVRRRMSVPRSLR